MMHEKTVMNCKISKTLILLSDYKIKDKAPALLLPNGSRTSVFSSDMRFDFRVRNGSGSSPHAMAG